MNKLVLAFDIERSGGTSEYETLAIGACVMNEDLVVLDTYYCNCYFPNDTLFEERCYNEFWSKNLDVLKTLIYTGEKSKNEREYEMIEGFQNFRKRWETFAANRGFSYYLVSDNSIFDGMFVNDLIFKHLKNTLPIPYSASTQEYERFYETHSIQKGILITHGCDDDWGLYDNLKKIYHLPDCNVVHDHNPVNDAHTIAFEMHMLFRIQKESVKFI